MLEVGDDVRSGDEPDLQRARFFQEAVEPSECSITLDATQTASVSMDQYDPEVDPDAPEWLALDEDERLILIEAYHRDARIRLPKAARRLHATIHAVVENQLASDDEPVIRALARLLSEGLSRHDAIHAIGSVVAEQIYHLLKLKDSPETTRIRYYAAIERLTAAEWRKNNE